MTLAIQNLSKCYKNGIVALDNFSIEIGTGMFGLIGPNGAGKSTLMRIVASLQYPDAGTITFQGVDIVKNPYYLRLRLGYLPQSFGVYQKETATDLLHYLAILKGVSSKKQRAMMVDEVLEVTNLTEVQNKQVSDYSGGMKQRFGIAQLLLNRPKLIIVDEPTAGLDPSERKRFLNVLRALGSENTVIFSTHIVEDVKDLCNDMAILHRGQMRQHQAPQEAIRSFQGVIWQKKVSGTELVDIEKAQTVISKNVSEDHQHLVRVCAKNKPAEGFHPAPPTLEDVYFLTLKND